MLCQENVPDDGKRVIDVCVESCNDRKCLVSMTAVNALSSGSSRWQSGTGWGAVSLRVCARRGVLKGQLRATGDRTTQTEATLAILERAEVGLKSETTPPVTDRPDNGTSTGKADRRNRGVPEPKSGLTPKRKRLWQLGSPTPPHVRRPDLAIVIERRDLSGEHLCCSSCAKAYRQDRYDDSWLNAIRWNTVVSCTILIPREHRH